MSKQPTIQQSHKYLDAIVLCGGKCGSTTLYSTLKNNGFDVLKMHHAVNYMWEFEYDGLYEAIDASSKDKKFFLIDSYRTPVERKMSSLFQNLPADINKSCEQLIDLFNDETEDFPHVSSLEEYHSINGAMDHYNVEHFTEFDFKKGYVKKEVGNIVFIKILYKDIDNWSNILSSIFNKDITMYNDNVTSDKPYAKSYGEFKQKYKVPRSYLEILKNDKEFKIYNTKEEQEEYINKWLENSYNDIPEKE
jgi:hypothetical protein